jgi:beta-galactosidase/beta-glucuronidase
MISVQNNFPANSPTHDLMYGFARSRDPGRPVQYEGLGHTYNDATDILCPMYPHVDDIIAMVSRDPLARTPHEHRGGHGTMEVCESEVGFI